MTTTSEVRINGDQHEKPAFEPPVFVRTAQDEFQRKLEALRTGSAKAKR